MSTQAPPITTPGSLRHPAREHRREFVVAVVLATLAAMAVPALLSLSGYLLARASEAPPILTLTTAIVGVRLFALVRASARYGERLVSHDLALRLLTQTRVRVFDSMVARSRGVGSGRLLDRLVADTETLQDRVVRVWVPGVALAVTAVTAVVVSAVILPSAAIALAAVLVVQVVFIAAIEAPSGRRRARELAERRESLTRELVSSLDGAVELVAWGADQQRAERVRRHGEEHDRLVRRDALRVSASAAASTVLGGVGAVIVMLVAAAQAHDGAIAGTVVPALALLAYGVIEVTSDLSDVLVARSEVAVAQRRIDATVEGPADSCEAPLPTTSGRGVQMRDVSVTRGGRELFHGVDLDVAPGETVALMGPSGVGKSVLTRVLLGLEASDAGVTRIDGSAVDTLDEGERAALICWAPQDPYLFPTSIADNVRIAKPTASDAQIEAALRAVGAGPWIDQLADGSATQVGEFGERCSGGERQRVGLARVALSDAPYVVLDEPASHLPEDEVLAALSGAIGGRAERGVLLVTHHDEELAIADRVVRLD